MTGTPLFLSKHTLPTNCPITQPWLYTRTRKTMALLAGNRVQEISLLRTVLVQVLTLGWKCLLVSRDMLQQCPPAPLPQELSTHKIGCFLQKQECQMRKGKAETSVLTMFQQAPQKKVTEQHTTGLPRPCMHCHKLSQVLYKATSGCATSGASKVSVELFCGGSSF